MDCKKCGQPAEIGGLCASCYMLEHRPASLPYGFDVFQCRACGKYLWKGGWLRISLEELVERVVSSNLEPDPHASELYIDINIGSSQRKRRFLEVKFEVSVHAKLSGAPWNLESSHELRIRNNQCDICSKRAGGYFEATLQVRAENRPLAEDERAAVVDMVYKLADKDDKIITHFKEAKGGFDIQISPTAFCKKLEALLRRTGLSTKSTAKLMTLDNLTSREVRRLNVSARFPEYRVGDYALFEGVVWRVLRFGRKTAILSPAGVEKNVPCESLKLVLKQEDAGDGMVISVGKTVQVMDSEYVIHEVEKPLNLKVEQGSKVNIITLGNQLRVFFR